MRKTLFLAAGLVLASTAIAHADPLTDWIASLMGWSVDDSSGAQPDDGPGSGTGIAD